MSRRHLGVAAVLLALAPAARASDPVGIYALIDKVVLEPSDGPAERVQVWGVFALARGNGFTYAAPERGVMYFKLAKDKKKEDVCRKEWADLKKVAGTKQVVAFGARYAANGNGTVRKGGGDPTKNPDVYPVGFGMTKVPAKNYMAKELLAFKPPTKNKDKNRP